MKKLTHWNLFLHHVLYYCKNKLILHRSWTLPLITIFVLSYLFHSTKVSPYIKKEEEQEQKTEIDSIFSSK